MTNDRYKIAVVDDEMDILDMINRYLAKTGKFEVTTFSNPVVAVDRIDSSYDLILLDIMMPQMDGLTALEKLIAKNKDIKVVMMTAYSTLDKVLKSHKEGATHYLMKPFESLGALEKKILDVIGKN